MPYYPLTETCISMVGTPLSLSISARFLMRALTSAPPHTLAAAPAQAPAHSLAHAIPQPCAPTGLRGAACGDARSSLPCDCGKRALQVLFRLSPRSLAIEAHCTGVLISILTP